MEYTDDRTGVQLGHPPSGHISKVDDAYWPSLIRQSTRGLTDTQVDEVAKLCRTNNRGVWHNVAIVCNFLHRCPCAPCARARGER